MKKTLSLLLALCMIVCLCACGSSAPQPAAEAGAADAAESDAAEAGETPAEPEPEPEKVYKTEDRLVLVKETVEGHRLPYSSATVTGRIFDEVIEYHYDEFGQLTGTEEKLEYPDVPDFFFAGEENERYAYSYTDEGELESVTMYAAPSTAWKCAGLTAWRAENLRKSGPSMSTATRPSSRPSTPTAAPVCR